MALFQRLVTSRGILSKTRSQNEATVFWKGNRRNMSLEIPSSTSFATSISKEKEYIKSHLLTLKTPVFTVPLPENISPYASDVEAKMMDWGSRFGLCADKNYEERVVRAKHGFLASRCYPSAQRDLLQTIADYFLWLFVFDDLYLDRVQIRIPEALLKLTSVIDVLDLDDSRARSSFGEPAFLDVTRRLRRLLPSETFQRFAEAKRVWASATGLQILDELQPPKNVNMHQYEAIRRHSSAMNPCFALSDVANGCLTTSSEYYRTDVQTLIRHANNITSWSNDIQSLHVEAHQDGLFRSMVTIRASQGHSLQESVDWTANRVQAEIDAFCSLADKVSESPSKGLRALVEGCKFWVRGYQDWVAKDTLRYSAEFAADDAND